MGKQSALLLCGYPGILKQVVTRACRVQPGGWVLNVNLIYFELRESQNRESNAAKKMAPLRHEQMDSWACHHLRKSGLWSVPHPNLFPCGVRDNKIHPPFFLPMSLRV